MALQAVLRSLVREGDLTIKLPGGSQVRLGDGSGPPLVARVTSAAWAARIAAKPGLGVGEAYMDGGLVLETGGMLAHGACLSREYGIPAVQVRDAMRQVPDAVEITVDGNAARVYPALPA